jgi:alpha-L-glutamate ligase-like protein
MTSVTRQRSESPVRLFIQKAYAKVCRAYTARSILRANGVLGMNQRNIDFIAGYNPRRLFPLVDDKLQTKTLAESAGVAVPRLIGVVREQHDVRDLADLLAAHDSFCIKPAKGSGGKGILVIVRSDQDGFYKPSGEVVSLSDIERHVSNVLAGLFSLGGSNDVALIEALIQFDNCFDGYSYEGVPDVRVIIFQGYPVMAMMRLSTHDSQGKANLHQGAVGVGLDIATGKAVRAVQFDQPVTHHPDTGKDLLSLEVPQWQCLLELASSCYEMCGLGYLGADLVLDRERGPLLLELNARPGLTIQVANNKGLLPRLKAVTAYAKAKKPMLERVEYAQTVLSKL